eukprot:scpid20686/ scgid6109/ 
MVRHGSHFAYSLFTEPYQNNKDNQGLFAATLSFMLTQSSGNMKIGYRPCRCICQETVDLVALCDKLCVNVGAVEVALQYIKAYTSTLVCRQDLLSVCHCFVNNSQYGCPFVLKMSKSAVTKLLEDLGEWSCEPKLPPDDFIDSCIQSICSKVRKAVEEKINSGKPFSQFHATLYMQKDVLAGEGTNYRMKVQINTVCEIRIQAYQMTLIMQGADVPVELIAVASDAPLGAPF